MILQTWTVEKNILKSISVFANFRFLTFTPFYGLEFHISRDASAQFFDYCELLASLVFPSLKFLQPDWVNLFLTIRHFEFDRVCLESIKKFSIV